MLPTNTHPSTAPAPLARVVGRWDLTAQVVNIVMGAAIFVLPGTLLPEMGGWAIAAVACAAAGVVLVVLSYAEAAGRYSEAGGMYRYAEDAFGGYVGAQVGLLYWFVRVTALAAIVNVFATYAAEFHARLGGTVGRVALITVAIVGAAAINIRGTRQTARAVNAFTVGRLLPLLILVVGGLAAVSLANLTTHPLPPSGVWARGVLLWVFAFGGFEATTIVASEVQSPERNAPRALVQGMAIVGAVYLLVQFIVAGILTDAASDRPLGDVARLIMGEAGAGLIAAGAMIATAGHIIGSTFASPRITFAMAQRGALPSWLSQVHRRFHTPYVSIVLFSALAWALAINGNFAWNASISAVTRLIVYGTTSMAVLRFRRTRGPSAFAVPVVVHVGAIAFCVWLFLNQTVDEAMAVAVTIVCATVVWLAVSRWAKPIAVGSPGGRPVSPR